MPGSARARSARKISISNDGGTQAWMGETRCVQCPPGHYCFFTSLYIFCRDFSHLEIMCSCKTPSSLNNVSLGRNVFVELPDFEKLDLAVILNSVGICGKTVTSFWKHLRPEPPRLAPLFLHELCCFMAHSFCENGASGTLLVWNWLRSSDELFEVDIDSGNTLRRLWMFSTTVRPFDT
jgi:hypothetical protein